jgi:hypothetical protein
MYIKIIPHNINRIHCNLNCLSCNNNKMQKKTQSKWQIANRLNHIYFLRNKNFLILRNLREYKKDWNIKRFKTIGKNLMSSILQRSNYGIGKMYTSK